MGTSITINGLNFGATQGSSTIKFGSVVATPTSWSNTQIVAQVPSGLANGQVWMSGVVNGANSLGAVSFTVGTPPVLSTVSPSSGSVGTSVTISGLNFGATQGSSTIKFGSVVATPTSWSNTQIVAQVPSGLANGQVWMSGVVNGVNSLGAVGFTVATPTPTITSISPNGGLTGSSVTILGTGFGATQGVSTVTINGTAAAPTSWNNNQITATVASGTTSGPLLVMANGTASNSINFIIGVPPTITASVSPPPNSAGWNNSAILVTFNCTAGGTSLSSCSPPQTVTTEGAAIAVSGTATDTDGISVSTNVVLNIERTLPTIAITSPVDQSVSTSASVAVAGTVTNSLTSVTSATCNGTAASFFGGGLSCNISLAPGVNLVMVTATDTAGNTAGARFHLLYSAALPAPASLQVTPAQVTMLVGDTQQFTAVDELGRPRTDASWTVSDSTIATISTDSFAILTGVAAGQVTVTASVGSVSAQTQVTVLTGSSLPVGTVRWSAPPMPGFTTQQIVEAVPSATNTPDLYSIDLDADGNTLVRAFTGDGQQLWSASLPNSQFGFLGPFMGDSSGGLVIGADNESVIDLDGQSGAVAFSTTNPSSFGNFILGAVGQDGSSYVNGTDPQTGDKVLYKLDTNSGQPSILFAAPLGVAASFGDPQRCEVHMGYSYNNGSLTAPIVGPDGSVYLGYTAGLSGTTTYTLCNNEPTNRTVTATSETGVVTIAPSGAVSLQPITTTSQTCIENTEPTEFSCTGTPPGPQVTGVLPDGSGGILAMWNDIPNGGIPQITDTTSGATYTAPLGGSPLIVLGENGNAFVTDGTSVSAFDPSSGSVQWTYQPAAGTSSIAAASGGGVTVIDGQFGHVALDANGTPGSPVSAGSLTNISYFGNSAWTGEAADGTLKVFAGDRFDWAISSWAFLAGDPEGQNSSPRFDFELVWCTSATCLGTLDDGNPDQSINFSIQGDDPPHTITSLSIAQQNLIKRNAENAFKLAFAAYDVRVGSGRQGTNTVYVVGQPRPVGNCARTPSLVKHFSRAYYEASMQEAQHTINSTNGSPTDALLQSIGEGIGNNSAHEIAHELVNAFLARTGPMDLDDNSVNTYNGASCDGSDAPWVYTGFGTDGHTPIHWSDNAKTGLNTVLGPHP